MDLTPVDWLDFILGRVMRFLEFPLIRPGYPPDRLGSHERRRDRPPEGRGAGTLSGYGEEHFLVILNGENISTW
jgi:hypothetical protein